MFRFAAVIASRGDGQIPRQRRRPGARKFTESWLHERQISRLRAGWRHVQLLDRELYGREFATTEEVAAFVKAESPPAQMSWFCELHEEWRDLYKSRLRHRKYADRELRRRRQPMRSAVSAAGRSPRL